MDVDLVRRIFTELANAEVILTFAAETLLNHLAERPELYTAVRPIELSETDVRELLDLKQGAGGRAVAQRTLRNHLRHRTGATYDTPFFIRPAQSRRALWFVHLSSTTAADGRLECWPPLKIATSSYGNAQNLIETKLNLRPKAPSQC